MGNIHDCDSCPACNMWPKFLELYYGWLEENKLEYSDDNKIMYEYPQAITTTTLETMIEYVNKGGE